MEANASFQSVALGDHLIIRAALVAENAVFVFSVRQEKFPFYWLEC